ncbi:MAG: alanine--tRNA ligase [Coriobacteriia bacterium]|nr:alanine--tRNA ligase [Coriobacteriia bacterium]
MKTAELREKYLAFFESKGCKRMPSSSLIPDDPSMLLTSAGMVQFKPYFMQKKQLEAPYIGTTTVQKCVRTTDIDIIGTTGRHLSFFEMLGNFSFGAYFKQEMCEWALEFSTEVLGFSVDKLYFTVYEDDNETLGIWESLGIDKSHISKLGKDDNFWVAGTTGPSGPCSELYYDQGKEFGCESANCAPGCDCARYIEFWNCVFTQYDLQEDGSLIDLPKKNIDTGLGLERTAAILQGVHSNYETDMLRGLIEVGERLSGVSYTNSFASQGDDASAKLASGQPKSDLSLRILADHARAITFMIGDGILPSNEGRGYVLRRLMRRAMRHGLLLGIESPFMSEYINAVIAEMGAVYHEIVENRVLIERIAHSEEERFAQTLHLGQGFLSEHLDALQPGEQLDGNTAFILHDRFGFPIDLTIEIAHEQGFDLDRAGFDTFMEQQRTQARAHAKGEAWSATANSLYEHLLAEQGPSEFVGYESASANAQILGILVDGQTVKTVQDGETAELILSRTPFYAEKGGQMADKGAIVLLDGSSDMPFSASFIVSNTVEHSEGIIAHVGEARGELSVGGSVLATIDLTRRKRIERNHTATHLLHYALGVVLGDHITQAGSLVAPERLRFDFTHFEPLTSEELTEVEELVNAMIVEDRLAHAYTTTLEEARADGVTALFGEKYGNQVRVLALGQECRELCGGTHVSHTSQIGLFKIISESSIGANVRRIEALTSLDALDRYKRAEQELERCAALLKTTPDEVSQRIQAQHDSLRKAHDELTQLKSESATGALAQHLDEAILIGGEQGYWLLVHRQDGLNGGELRETADFLRQKLGDSSAVVLGSLDADGMPSLLAAATNKAVAAGFDGGALVRELAPVIGGRGGGKPSMAQAGGKDATGLDAALAEVCRILEA